VFEFVSTAIGAQGTVCGGGRYDGLVEQLGGAKAPGIGFAMGIERLLLLMENTGVEIPDTDGVKIYFAPMGEKEYEKAFSICTALRLSGINAEIDHMARGIKAQFKYADKIKAKFVAVLGSSELESGVIKIKDMLSGTEEEVALDSVVDFVKGL
jgi:histidyl-tRNA synthetase